MEASVKKLKTINKDNVELALCLALYDFSVLGQEEKWEKWEESDLKDQDKLALKKKWEAAFKNKNYTKLVPPCIDGSGKLIKHPESLVISIKEKAQTCYVDILGSLNIDLNDIPEVKASTSRSLSEETQSQSYSKPQYKKKKKSKYTSPGTYQATKTEPESDLPQE